MKRLALCSFVLLALAACGERGGGAVDAESDAWMDGIPGTYATDVLRTHGTKTKDKEGNEIELTEAQLEALQKSQGAASMRLVMNEDNTFELWLGEGEAAFHTAGTWKEIPGGLSMVTKTVNGEPAPAEAQVVEKYSVERGYIIGDLPGGKKYYLQKQKPR